MCFEVVFYELVELFVLIIFYSIGFSTVQMVMMRHDGIITHNIFFGFYFVDEFYGPEQERGIRWDDPRFAIQWPAEPVVLSDKDRGHRDFDPAWHLAT